MSTRPNKANPSNERFLFCMTPTTLAMTAPCGCSLQLGAQLVAIIFIVSTISPFISGFQAGGLWNVLYYGIISSLYLIAGISTLYSSYTTTYEYAHTANFIYNFLFLISVLDNILIAFFIFNGDILPLGLEVPPLTQGFYFLAAVGTILLIHMYMIWIVFCFMVHIKNRRKGLVKGDIYKSYEEFERDIEMTYRT
jgi:hypothetical protein